VWLKLFQIQPSLPVNAGAQLNVICSFIWLKASILSLKKCGSIPAR
jgi:hypothetical protein